MAYKKIESYFNTIYTNNTNHLVYETKDEAIKLFKQAGIEDSFIPVTQPMGYGRVASFKASTFGNYPSPLNVFFSPQLRMFSTATGVYKKKIFESINPLYWIELVIFFPKFIFQYLGISGETIVIKIINLIYWFISSLLLLFKDDIKNFIINNFPKDFFNF